ncbi:MAG: ABC transporter ATP-binding protein [Elusimicrobia bacterium]|nr:ABC transporter ATP-binding protein [Elusimicrobiota bacterium]
MDRLVLSGIVKHFNKIPILSGIDLRVREGEFVSLLGPSGCGKTTLLRLIAGLERPDEGRILLTGRLLNDVPAEKRNIAMVFQSYALYPHLSVRKNIALALELRKTDPAEIDRRVREAAGLLDIAGLLNRRPRELSGGQRQRVALARAIVREPAVFLLDEPLSNLDALLREKTRAELKLLFRRLGGTVVYVTHDQIEALTLSDKIVLLNQGCIEQEGTPDELYRNPQSMFTASFIGSPQINWVGGRLEGRRFSGPSFTVKIADVPDQASGEAMLGLRPDEIVFAASAGPSCAPAEIVLGEAMGRQTLWTLKLNSGVEIRVLSVHPNPGAAGQKVHLDFAGCRLHCFDAATGRRLNL